VREGDSVECTKASTILFHSISCLITLLEKPTRSRVSRIIVKDSVGMWLAYKTTTSCIVAHKSGHYSYFIFSIIGRILVIIKFTVL
jgi:hypothetical protein